MATRPSPKRNALQQALRQKTSGASSGATVQDPNAIPGPQPGRMLAGGSPLREIGHPIAVQGEADGAALGDELLGRLRGAQRPPVADLLGGLARNGVHPNDPSALLSALRKHVGGAGRPPITPR